MTDIYSKIQRSKNMSLIKSENTKLELKVQKWLFNKGLRYRLHYSLPGKPDIVFPGKKIVIFVNGCFWHQHGCKYSKHPKSNIYFWKEKLNNNHRRDNKNYGKLKLLHWKTIVIWQCQIRTLERLNRKMTSVYALLH